MTSIKAQWGACACVLYVCYAKLDFICDFQSFLFMLYTFIKRFKKREEWRKKLFVLCVFVWSVLINLVEVGWVFVCRREFSPSYVLVKDWKKSNFYRISLALYTQSKAQNNNESTSILQFFIGIIALEWDWDSRE